MGAADVVPGVSGGTIAFITGIYEELLNTINSVNFEALKTLKSKGLKSFWKHINGNFIVAHLCLGHCRLSLFTEPLTLAYKPRQVKYFGHQSRKKFY